MKFVDANVLLHAVLLPNRPLSKEEKTLKAAAKGILSRINAGEPVLITAIHLSEVANVLESRQKGDFARQFIQSLLLRDTITVFPVGREGYLLATELAHKNSAGINDAMAIIAMASHKTTEIYSFDTGFDKVGGVIRLQS